MKRGERMNESKYRVTDIDGIILADNMTFEMALVFIRGFKDAFYNERLELAIEEIVEVKE